MTSGYFMYSYPSCIPRPHLEEMGKRWKDKGRDVTGREGEKEKKKKLTATLAEFIEDAKVHPNDESVSRHRLSHITPT